MEVSGWVLLGASILVWIHKGLGLECYVCENQDSNKDKCIKTTMQCDKIYKEPVCRTWVRWGIPPYWTPHGDRIHFISKGCDDRTKCNTKSKNTMSFCKRDWYADWACHECCSGDLCNYYVTLGGSSMRPQSLVIILLAAATTLLKYCRL